MLNYEWIKHHKKELILLCLLTVGITAIQFYSRVDQNRRYIGEDGKVTAIKRHDANDTMSIPLIIEAEYNGETIVYEVILSPQKENKDDLSEEVQYTQTEILEKAVDNMVSQLERSDDLMIRLPDLLNDTIHLTWRKPSMNHNFLLLFIFPMGVIYLYENEKTVVRLKKKKQQEQIQKALPVFNDQILLLMNSGLIFHDAFVRIGANYFARERCDDFGLLIIQIIQKADASGQSIVSVMEESKKDISMREYSRMVNIIADHQIKGVDLKEKLESESHLLWECRKNIALQKGREMETKMTFPLALLLMTVVIVTSVPAMMSM